MISKKTFIAAWLLALPAIIVTSSVLTDDTMPEWKGDFKTRVEALALIQTLNADLLSHDSATLILEGWCAAHRLAAPAKIVAERVRGADKQATGELRALLHVDDSEPISYRHVRLRCGTHILSEADNWYVPSRLTPAMNAMLETTDTPFGHAVQALSFQRHTILAKLLWSPLPDGWEMNGAGPEKHGALKIPSAILEHRAVLNLPDGVPFSALVETYTSAVLDFPDPMRSWLRSN
jgi:chorismate-pyruvate lyase